MWQEAVVATFKSACRIRIPQLLPVKHTPLMHEALAAERSLLCRFFFLRLVFPLYYYLYFFFPSNVSLSFSLNLSKEMKTERNQKSRHMFKIERDTI